MRPNFSKPATTVFRATTHEQSNVSELVCLLLREILSTMRNIGKSPRVKDLSYRLSLEDKKREIKCFMHAKRKFI